MLQADAPAAPAGPGAAHRRMNTRRSIARALPIRILGPRGTAVRCRRAWPDPRGQQQLRPRVRGEAASRRRARRDAARPARRSRQRTVSFWRAARPMSAWTDQLSRRRRRRRSPADESTATTTPARTWIPPGAGGGGFEDLWSQASLGLTHALFIFGLSLRHLEQPMRVSGRWQRRLSACLLSARVEPCVRQQYPC